MVVLVHFEADKIACEPIYRDQASVLAQTRVLNRVSMPGTGVEQSRNFENPQLQTKELR